MPTTADLRAAIDRYATTVATRDADAYASLYTLDAVQVDPYPTGVHHGREEIKAFMKQSFDACETMAFEVEECHPVADKAAVRFHITVGLEGGVAMHIRGVEIFTVTEESLISAVEAYWGEEDVTLG